MKTTAVLLAAALLLTMPAAAATIAEKTAGMQRFDGFLPLFWDESTGTLYMEIGRLDEEILYVGSLAAGLGSNDIGLDRGQLGDSAIIEFRRAGNKVLMVQPNFSYRATSDNAEERLAVEEAFAVSTLWGFTVAAETSGRVL
ncbi:MAG TPA: peptidase, partial [Thermoanaerobaculia bacterium]|nr:peptidase [Thermoanaerobaculia bacterium]